MGKSALATNMALKVTQGQRSRCLLLVGDVAPPAGGSAFV